MDIIKRLEWRYATKKFDTNKKLSEDKLHILKEAFNLTATSFGLQTIKLLVLENETIRASLVQHAYYQKQVLEASHLLVICVQEAINEEDINIYYENVKTTRKTEESILEPYRISLLKMMQKMTLAEQHQWSKNQAYIALGNLMTVCAIEGIDSCPMEGFSQEKYDALLNLQQFNLKSVLLLPVGYRAEDDMFADFKKVRKTVNEAVIEL